MRAVEADSNPVREREWVDLFTKHHNSHCLRWFSVTPLCEEAWTLDCLAQLRVVNAFLSTMFQ